MDQRKRIAYQIHRRATLELELILVRFWKQYGPRIPDTDLDDLERILAMEELDLMEILLGKRPVPPGYRRDLFEKMKPPFGLAPGG